VILAYWRPTTNNNIASAAFPFLLLTGIYEIGKKWSSALVKE
jgi:hypothetical protein